MVMHARKHPRISDGYFDRNPAHPYEGSTRYSKSPFGEACNDKSPANENTICNESPDSRPSPRYYNKSSYSQRLKERERDHMDSSSIKSPLPKDRNNRSRDHQTPSNSSSSRKGFDGVLNSASGSSSSASRTNHDRGSHTEEKEKRLQVGDWSEHVSSSGKKYYYNCRTEVSQWEKPREWIEWEKHQGVYKPLESNRTKGSSSSRSSEKHSNHSSSGGSGGGSHSGSSSNPNSISASFRSSQSHHSSSQSHLSQSSAGRQTSSSHAQQSSGGSSSSSTSSGGRCGRPASSDEHHSSSNHPHYNSHHHQHNSNSAHHSSSALHHQHHHGRSHEDHHSGGSYSSENKSNTSNSFDHRHYHRRSESFKDSQAQDMDISPDTSEGGHHSQQDNSRGHISHHQPSHGLHSNEQVSHQQQQRSQCRMPISRASSSGSLAGAQLLSPSQVTLANLPKLISQMAGTKGLPNLKELSPEEALQTIQQALQLTKQLGGLNRSPHGAGMLTSDHQHRASAPTPTVSSQGHPQHQHQQQQANNTTNNNNNCSQSSSGSHSLPFVPNHGDAKDVGGLSPASECNTHSSRQASPTSSVSSLPSLPAAGPSSLASLKPVTPSLTPSLANYFREDLISHVTGWQADHAERQASRYSEEAHGIGSLNSTRVSAELKMARSLVRLAEIQATLQEQRRLSLQKLSQDQETFKLL